MSLIRRHLLNNARMVKNHLFEIPKLEAIDIDEKEDWFLQRCCERLKEESNYA